jgi:hypothetical protein
VRASITNNYFAAKAGYSGHDALWAKGVARRLESGRYRSRHSVRVFRSVGLRLTGLALAQYLHDRELRRDDRFWEFVKEQIRR